MPFWGWLPIALACATTVGCLLLPSRPQKGHRDKQDIVSAEKEKAAPAHITDVHFLRRALSHLGAVANVMLILRTAPERRSVARSDDFSANEYLMLLKHRDKCVFFVGAVDMGLTVFLLGAFPQHFFIWHTVRVVPLYIVRGVRYKTINYHSFLLDFCYFYNAALLYFLWFDRTNHALFRGLWAFGFGSLLGAVAGFHNSLVFHSLDKLTSVCFHLSPALVLWSMRWYGPDTLTRLSGQEFAVCPPGSNTARWWDTPDHSSGGDCALSLPSTLLDGSKLHLVWATLFYVYVFVIKDNLVENFAYMIKKKGSLVWRVCSPFKHHLVQKAMYMVLHFSLSLVFALPGPWFFKHFWLGSAAIFAMMLTSVWNGAEWYIDYHPLHYHDNVVEKAKRL